MSDPIFPYNQYSTSAAYYDLDNRDKVRDDIRFYIDVLKGIKGEVLELCCGTGRVTIPLAENGIQITGLDISKEMLSIFRSKLNSLVPSVKERIAIVEGDMIDFSLNKFFECIFIPFSSFQGLTENKEIERSLQTIYKHLIPGGTFIVHSFKPPEIMDRSWEYKEERDNIVYKNDDGSVYFKRTSVNRSIDLENQIVYPDLFYYTYRDGKVVDRLVEHLKLKYYSEEQLQKLLEKNNFEIVNKFGYYDKRPISDKDASEMIFVCKKQ